MKNELAYSRRSQKGDIIVDPFWNEKSDKISLDETTTQ